MNRDERRRYTRLFKKHSADPSALTDTDLAELNALKTKAVSVGCLEELETKALASNVDDETEAAAKKAADETKAPETKAPETKAAETKAPETKAPETKAAKTKAPELTPVMQAMLKAGEDYAAEEAAKAKSAQGTLNIAPEALTALADTMAKAMAVQHPRDDEFGAGTKGASSMQHQTSPHTATPMLTTRNGSCTIAAKQFVNLVMEKGLNEGIPDSMHAQASKAFDAWFEGAKQKAATNGDWSHMVANSKAMGSLQTKAITSDATPGSNYVPSDLSATILIAFLESSQLAQLVLGSSFQQPTDPYTFPVSLTLPPWALNNAQNTAVADGEGDSAQLVLKTAKFMGQTNVSYEADEDSIHAAFPFASQQLAESGVVNFEQCCLNGDTAAAHQDTDVVAANDVRKGFDGFRKMALASAAQQVDIGVGGITPGNLLSIMARLDRFGTNSADLAWIVPINVYYQFLGVIERLTKEVAGGKATLDTGILERIFRIPIIPTTAGRTDLNAAGVFAGGSTRTSITLVNWKYIMSGFRRQMLIESDRDIETQTNKVVASYRRSLMPWQPVGPAFPVVAQGRNLGTI